MLGDDPSLGARCLDASAQRKVQVLNAWPLLLSLEQVCAYLDLSPVTFRRVCPVPAIALGAAVARWNRNQIDEWVNSLPPKNQAFAGGNAADQPRPYQPAEAVADERRNEALQKIRDRHHGRAKAKNPSCPAR